MEMNGSSYGIRAPRAEPSGDRRQPPQGAPGSARAQSDPSNDLEKKSEICLPYREDYSAYPQWVENARRRRVRRRWATVFLHARKHVRRARPSGDRHQPCQQAPGNDRPHSNPPDQSRRKSDIYHPYSDIYQAFPQYFQTYPEWVETCRRRVHARLHWATVFLHITKHTPQHALVAPSGRENEKTSALPTHQLPSSLTSLPVRTRHQLSSSLISLPIRTRHRLSSSLTSLPVRTRHPLANLDNNDDSGKNPHGINPSAPAAQKDQMKLHGTSEITTPPQNQTNISSGSGIPNTGLTTLEQRFEAREVDRPATNERPTSPEYTLATEVEEDLRNADYDDSEDIE